MKGQSLWGRASKAILLAVAVLVVGSFAATAGAEGPGAHAARRTLNLSGTAYLHLVRKSGNVLYERGVATGTLPGTVTARLVTSIARVTGTVTFYPRGGGSLTLSAVGYPQSASVVTRFSGSCAVRSGTGRFRRALGSGSFNGTANRRTWAVTVHARARVTY